MDEEQEQNPYKALLIQDVEEEWSKPGILKWKSGQHSEINSNMYSIFNILCHYGLEVNAPEERYGTKMNQMLQVSERELKEVSFNQILKGWNKITYMCLKESN